MDKNVVFRILFIVLAAVILFVLVSNYNKRQQSQPALEPFAEGILPFLGEQKFGEKKDVLPSEPLNNEDFRGVDFSGQKLESDCFPKDRLTAEDLLPKDAANSKWAQVNPAGQGDVKDQNFLQAGHHYGLNTTMGVKKNANLQLRSDPVVPKSIVSPWLNSDIQPDTMRKPLEIGETC
jgi:hypothetical protein